VSGFEGWVKRVQKRIAFDGAVATISAQSIAMMKVNSMRAKAQ
jgi:hypothetical protein